MKVKSLFIYPVKGCAGIEVGSLDMHPYGPKHDREFMIVDERGQFLTQREYPKMSQIKATLSDRYLTMRFGGTEAGIPFSDYGTDLVEVTVWGDTLRALDEGMLPARALSKFLGISCRLVRHLPDKHPRLRQSSFLNRKVQVSFTDGYPLLVISEESLADLNSRLLEPVPMNRFRPNIVVSVPHAYDEDSWRTLRVGDVLLEGANACVRCVTTTTDQATGKRDERQEPLRTLAMYRKTDKGVVFGRNFVNLTQGFIRKGDVLKVLE